MSLKSIPSWTCGFVVTISCLLKLLTINTTLYYSTDFEVHRNWMAITHSLPFREWYKEARNVWTLDYPPFFAYFEYILSQLAALVDPSMLSVDNMNYSSYSTIAFQRLSVILVSDLVLAACTLYALAPAGSSRLVSGLVLTLFSSSLFLVDHIHFQYNGMLLGLLILAAALIDRGRIFLGAFVYMILVFFKHIYLYAAPVFFIFCIRRFIVSAPLRTSLNRLGGLVLIVLGVSLVALVPLVLSGQFSVALSRMFPFGRGLVHAYWAPNFWALYLLGDRVLGKLLHVESGGMATSTGGVVQVTKNLVLPNIAPGHTMILTLVVYIPLLVLIWRKSHKIPLMAFVGFGNAICFMCGWHIHEKAILMVYYPLMVYAIGSGRLQTEVWMLSVVACASLLPLLPRSDETCLKWILFATGVTLDWIALRPISLSRICGFMLSLSFASEVYRVFVHGLLMRESKYEFLPLMMNSVVCAVLLVLILAISFQLLRDTRESD